MKDFHGLIGKLLIVWLSVYTLLFLPGLAKGLALYVISDFTMPTRHYFDMIYTVYTAALWMVPTLFLVVSYLLSRPQNRTIRG